MSAFTGLLVLAEINVNTSFTSHEVLLAVVAYNACESFIFVGSPCSLTANTLNAYPDKSYNLWLEIVEIVFV